MNILKKLFGNINMTWNKVIIFSIITGVYTGIVNQIPYFEETSFQDIAVTMEWWLLFAVIIAINVKSAKDSALKIFTFFMISQPIVFLVELPMLGFEQSFGYYKMWFFRILLTLPGGFVAYYAKKDNILGALILSVATSLLGVLGCTYFIDCMRKFPAHLLTVIFCIIQILILTLILQKKLLNRLIVLIITFSVIIGTFFIISANESTYSMSLPDGNWECITEFNDGSSIVIDGSDFIYKYNELKRKEKKIIFENESGNKIIYSVKIKNNILQIERLVE